MLVGDGVKDWACREPSKIAIIGPPGSQLSYGDLWNNIQSLRDGLCHGLRLNKGQRVALISSNSPRFLEIFLAAVQGGMVVAPLNPALTLPEVNYLLGKMEPDLIVAERRFWRLHHDLSLGGAKGLVLDGKLPGMLNYQALFDEDPGKFNLFPRDQDPFFISFTSGSTGRPQGVWRNHLSWASSFKPMGEVFGLTPDDHMLIPGPLYYSGSLYSCLQMLELGGTVTLLPHFQMRSVLKCLEKATAVFMVPSMYQLIAGQGESIKKIGHASKILITAGAKMSSVLKLRLLELFPGSSLFEYYGSAETSFVSVLGPGDQKIRPESVGCPLPQVEFSLRNKFGGEVSAGEVGSLWVKSPWLAIGYWGDPQRSAEVFRQGWAGVGDLARRDAEGYIYLCGRESMVINRAGSKVYPLEVEGVLLSFPGISEAVVAPVPDPLRGEKVGAWVVPGVGEKVNISLLKEHVKSCLAPYKRPDLFFVIESLPRNPAGKIDYTLLGSGHKEE